MSSKTSRESTIEAFKQIYLIVISLAVTNSLSHFPPLNLESGGYFCLLIGFLLTLLRFSIGIIGTWSRLEIGNTPSGRSLLISISILSVSLSFLLMGKFLPPNASQQFSIHQFLTASELFFIFNASSLFLQQDLFQEPSWDKKLLKLLKNNILLLSLFLYVILIGISVPHWKISTVTENTLFAIGGFIIIGLQGLLWVYTSRYKHSLFKQWTYSTGLLSLLFLAAHDILLTQTQDKALTIQPAIFLILGFSLIGAACLDFYSNHPDYLADAPGASYLDD